MCNQTVGLVAAELERKGISTVCLQLLRRITEAVQPPRALCLPFAHGYPLDRPNDPPRQLMVMRRALAMLEDRFLVPPVIQDLEPSG